MKHTLFFFTTFLLLCDFQINAQLPFELSLDVYASGFSSPVDIAHAGDERLFVIERSGRIKIIDENKEVLSTPFLDIDSRVHNTGNQSEQGLLGLTFHPQYLNNGYFYIHYTANNDDSVISRFSVSSDDANLADPDSEFEIMRIDQPYSNHNGGCIKFGPEGYLYIGLGDGGSADDPQNRAQNRQTLLGKMLRIDVDNGSPYIIPSTNPFVADDETLDEIWSVGLRNPWKFCFDRTTNDLWISDVGQGKWEEVNKQSASSGGGENYGWRCYEGAHNFNLNGCSSDAAEYTDPFLEYNHLGLTHCSITGGYVYRGPNTSLHQYNLYFYADYCSGYMWCSVDNDGEVEQVEVDRFFGMAISSFGEGNDGELYLADLVSGRISHLNLGCDIDPLIEVTEASCEAANNGCIEINFPNSTIDYDLELSNATGQNIDEIDFCNLQNGNYSLIISDPNSSCTEMIQVEIPLLVFEFNIVQNGPLSAPASYDFYQWFLEGIAIENANNSNYSPTELGIYTVEITDENGCKYLSNPFDVTVVSLDLLKGMTELELYPNPIEDILFVEMETKQKMELIIQIFNSSAILVHEQNLLSKGVSKFALELHQLPASSYTLVINHGSEKITRNFIKN